MNAIPWKLMREQRDFSDNIVLMEAAFRVRPKETDPSDLRSPFTKYVFPSFREEHDPINHLGLSRVQILLAGINMGQALTVLEDQRPVGATDEFVHLKAIFDLSYDVAHWLDSVAHFF